MTELKPCKLCGSGNMYLCKHYVCDGIELNILFCNDCKTSFYNENYEEDEDSTRDWWNTLALPIPDTPEMVRALDDAYEAGRKSAERTCEGHRCEETDEWVCHKCGGSLAGHMFDPVRDGFVDVPNFCPNCGARIVGD